jgi:RNA polymerase sigma-70 factor, ECF subfamily
VSMTAAPARSLVLGDELQAHERLLWNLCYRMTGVAADADDLVQETFLRAYAAWETYTPGTGCKSWLFTICRNIYLREAGRNARMVATDDPEAEAMASAGLYHYAVRRGLDTMFDRIDLGPAVERAIAAIPDDYRDVVILVDVQGCAYDEAARVLGIPLGTVRSRLFRARRLLQQSLLAFAEDAGFAAAARQPADASGGAALEARGAA